MLAIFVFLATKSREELLPKHYLKWNPNNVPPSRVLRPVLTKIILHLLLFITRKYAIIYVKRRSIARIDIH